MAVETSATTLLKISAGVPATFNVAGYAALSYTTVGEVTNIPEFCRTFLLVTHKPIATRGEQKFKGGFNEGSIGVALGLDTDDAGQILMKAAALSDSLYAFSITLPSGDVYYFQGLTMSFKVNVSSVDNISTATATIELTTSNTGVGIVESLAA